MSTGYGWEGVRHVCATLLGVCQVPEAERLCCGSVYLGRYNKCSTYTFTFNTVVKNHHYWSSHSNLFVHIIEKESEETDGSVGELEVTPVSAAIARHLNIDLSQEGRAARNRRGIAIIVHGAPMSGMITNSVCQSCPSATNRYFYTTPDFWSFKDDQLSCLSSDVNSVITMPYYATTTTTTTTATTITTTSRL